MPQIKLTAFSGETPRIIPRLMPATAAQSAVDVRIEDGSLAPYRKPTDIHSFNEAFEIGTIYKDGDTWRAFEGLVHFARGPVASERLYYTGDGVPKVRVGNDVYNLAVPQPVSALTATPSGGGSGDIEVRVYAFTYVTSLGEESEPSPLSAAINWQPGETVTLSGFPAVPTGRAITKQRIYRSQTGAAGTDLYFIAERNAGTGNYVDSIAPDRFVEPLPSRNYNPPDDDMQGLTALPNGMLAGFVGKQLCFSEPFVPHAWPEIYRITMDWTIVALAASGDALWVLTTGQPYLVTGTTPSGMASIKVEANYPCINAKGVVDLGFAVAYPTNEGLAVTRGGTVVIGSVALFTETDWRRLSPGTMRAGQLRGRWIGSYDGTDELGQQVKGSLIIDLAGDPSFLIRSAVNAKTWHYDLAAGELFYLDQDGDSVKQFDPVGGDPSSYYWKSKEFVLKQPVNMGVILVETGKAVTAADIAARQAAIDAVIAANAILIAAGSVGGDIASVPIGVTTVGGDLLAPLPDSLGSNVSVGVYADGVRRATVAVTDRVQRLPSGYKGSIYEIDVAADIPVEQITLARTMDELKMVQ